MELIQEIGSYAGLAAVVGLAVLSALYFSQARDVKRLREWAASAPDPRAEPAARSVQVQPRQPQGAAGSTPAAAPGGSAAQGGVARPSEAPSGQALPAPAVPGAPAPPPVPAPSGQAGRPVPAQALAAGARPATAAASTAASAGSAPPAATPAAQGRGAPAAANGEPAPGAGVAGAADPSAAEATAAAEEGPALADDRAPSAATEGGTAVDAGTAEAPLDGDATAAPDSEALASAPAGADAISRPGRGDGGDATSGAGPADGEAPTSGSGEDAGDAGSSGSDADADAVGAPSPDDDRAGAGAGSAADTAPTTITRPDSPYGEAGAGASDAGRAGRAAAGPTPASAAGRVAGASGGRPAPPPLGAGRATRIPPRAPGGGSGPSRTTVAPPRPERPRHWYSRRSRLLPAIAGALALGAVAIFGFSQLSTEDEGAGDAQRGANASGGASRQAPVRAADVTVSVLNGTTVPGLAAQMGDRIESLGFGLGNVTNSSDQQRAESVVLYTRGAEREAALVGRRLGIGQRERIDPQSQTLAGDARVVVIAGADQTR